MWKDSTELLDYALREPEKAIENKTGNVKIILMNNFLGEKEDMIRIVEQLELKTITEMLREEYSGYNIRSEVETGTLRSVLTLRTGCNLFYPLKWKLTIVKKATKKELS